jgi:putative ABC transport system substrate-binding protein
MAQLLTNKVMRRREFTAGMLLAVVPSSVRTEQRAARHRIAIFHPAIPTTLLTETGGGSAWRASF